MNDLMKAGVLFGAGDIRYVDRPLAPLGAGMVRIKIRRVGVCGSDIHYFNHGRCGAFVARQPFILGHELSGTVTDVATDVPNLNGARVTVNPARPCRICNDCRSGRTNLCAQTIMLGSASTTPPTDGAMAEFVTVRADQCHVLPDGIGDGVGAMIEPFAVALHAIKRVGSVSGLRVLVTGGGPIGLLIAMTARAFGASTVILSDPLADRRRSALALAADEVIDPTEPHSVTGRDQTFYDFDTVFEASGSAHALRNSFQRIRRGGIIVQVGTLPSDEIPLPANQIMTNEIQVLGSFRYGDIFDEALRLVARGRVKLEPLISSVVPLAEVAEAMGRAAGRNHNIKVQIAVA